METETTTRQLPFEFARTHRVLVDADSGGLLLGPGYSLEAALDVARQFPLTGATRWLDENSFDQQLRTEYSKGSFGCPFYWKISVDP